MFKFSYLRNIPQIIYFIGFISIISGVLNAFLIILLAGLIQIFLYICGFISIDSINNNILFISNYDNKIILSLIIFTIILQGLSLFAQTFINIIFAEKFNFETKKNILSLIFHSDNIKYFESGLTSNLFSQIIPKSSSYIASLLKFITLFIQLILLACFCLYIMPYYFILSLFLLLLTSPFFIFLNVMSKKYGKFIIKSNKKMSLQIMRSIKNYLFINILGLSKIEKNKSINFALDYYNNFMKSNLYYSLASSVPTTIGTSLIIFLFYNFSISSVNKVDVLSFFYIFYRFISMLSQNVTIINSLSIESPNFENLSKIYDEFKVIKSNIRNSKKNNIDIVINEDLNPLEVKNLTFKYSKNEKLILNNLSFKLNKSSVLLIKGPSGTGKTTLLMNLIGIIKNNGGSIKWFENDLSNYDQQYFRSLIGYVGPETYIIAGSIIDNLCYGLNYQPTQEDIEEACLKSQCLEYINSLNNKFNSVLSEQGEGLSMGQKQRLGLARAFLRKPKILILDEFTSNLDKNNENLILKQINLIKEEMIVMIATHSSAFDSTAAEIINLDLNENN